MAIWQVERWVANKWEVGAKDPDGNIVVEPLFQVKAWLIRRQPEPIFPVVQPVACRSRYRQPSPPQQGLKRALIICDPHFGFHRSTRTANLEPFHDRQVLDLILQLARAVKPDRIDILGDLLDLPEWSDKFIKSPQFYWSTQPALLECHWWLKQFRAARKAAEIKCHEGNHDKRIRESFMKHIPAAYGLRAVDEMHLDYGASSMPRLLALESLAIEWVADYPDDLDWLNEALCLRHGNIARGKTLDTAKAVAMEADETEIFGHIHRLEWASRTEWHRNGFKVVMGFSPGCACRIDGMVPGRTRRQQWQNGCAVVDYDEGRLFSIAPVFITEGQAVWNGRLFVGRDRIADIKRDLPGWNWE